MPSSSSAPDLLPLLPVSLPSLLSFLSTPFATSLIQASTNNFFAYAPAAAAATGETDDKGKGKVVLHRGEQGCWDRLPVEWRSYFDGVAEGERQEVLKDLADGRCDRVSSLSL
jgi:hypothetical protein